MEFTLYRLPDGTHIKVDATAAKGELFITFTQADKKIVDAIRVLNTGPYYNYVRQCWVENGIVLECGHVKKMSLCYACAHAGDKIE